MHHLEEDYGSLPPSPLLKWVQRLQLFFSCCCLILWWEEQDFLLLLFLSVSIVTQSCTHSVLYSLKEICSKNISRKFTTVPYLIYLDIYHSGCFSLTIFYNILVVLHVNIEQFWLLFIYIAYVKLDLLCLWRSMSTPFCIVVVLSFFLYFYILVASPLLVWKPAKSQVWKWKTEKKRTALALIAGATQKWKLPVFLTISKVLAIFFFPVHKHHSSNG